MLKVKACIWIFGFISFIGFSKSEANPSGSSTQNVRLGGKWKHASCPKETIAEEIGFKFEPVEDSDFWKLTRINLRCFKRDGTLVDDAGSKSGSGFRYISCGKGNGYPNAYAVYRGAGFVTGVMVKCSRGKKLWIGKIPGQTKPIRTGHCATGEYLYSVSVKGYDNFWPDMGFGCRSMRMLNLGWKKVYCPKGSIAREIGFKLENIEDYDPDKISEVKLRCYDADGFKKDVGFGSGSDFQYISCGNGYPNGYEVYGGAGFCIGIMVKCSNGKNLWVGKTRGQEKPINRWDCAEGSYLYSASVQGPDGFWKGIEFGCRSIEIEKKP